MPDHTLPRHTITDKNTHSYQLLLILLLLGSKQDIPWLQGVNTSTDRYHSCLSSYLHYTILYYTIPNLPIVLMKYFQNKKCNRQRHSRQWETWCTLYQEVVRILGNNHHNYKHDNHYNHYNNDNQYNNNDS